jgi:hypothetical protein
LFSQSIQEVILALFSGIDLGLLDEDRLRLHRKPVVTRPAFHGLAGKVLVDRETLAAFGTLDLQIHKGALVIS